MRAMTAMCAMVVLATTAYATVDDNDLPDDQTEATTSQPTSQPATTQPTTTTTSSPTSQATSISATTQPARATSAVSVSPDIDRILTRLEKKRDEIRDFQSDIRYQLYEVIPDARRTQTGLMRYRAGTDQSRARFMVHFDSLYQDTDDIRIKQKEWFCFDGRMFREIREHTKNAIDREVVHEGEKIDPFELGQGPFPMPFGQKKAEMLKNFDIVMKNDPKQPAMDHIVLTPKADTRLAKQYKRIEFFLAKDDQIPQQVISEDRHDNIITVDFKNVVINAGIADDQLWIEPPTDYQRSVVND
jgi:hypothetical protein